MNIRQKLACWIAGNTFYVVERGYLDDVEYRFSCVLNHVTETMSKTNYTLDAMYAEIDDYITKQCEQYVEDEIESGVISRVAP